MEENIQAAPNPTVAAPLEQTNHRPTPQQQKDKSMASTAAEPKDNLREIIETVVFVIVLVLLLKSFVAEAFVIPTGSMAETLYGYQKIVSCPKCFFEFPVNASSEVDPPDRRERSEVKTCTCPNCLDQISIPERVEQLLQDNKAYIEKILYLEAAARPLGVVLVVLGILLSFFLSRAGMFNLILVLVGFALYVLSPFVRDYLLDDFYLRPKTGDRVLVDKSLYDLMTDPERFDVVVFKYPENPQQNHVQMNYIKRLVGKPGDTMAIYYGDLYMTQDLKYEGDDSPKPESPDQARHRKFMYEDNREAYRVFDQQIKNQFEKKVDGKDFEIVRKEPDKIMALRRIVYDNDFQAKDLIGVQPPRWAPERQTQWTPDQAQEPRRFSSTPTPNELSWLNYRHILRTDKPGEKPGVVYRVSDAALQALRVDGVPDAVVKQVEFLRSQKLRGFDEFMDELNKHLKPQDIETYKAKILTHTVAPALVTDFMGYNSGKTHLLNENWVGDLMLECDVTIDQPVGELVLDLAKGVDRFQARWDLANGDCTLVRLHKIKKENGETETKEEVLGAEKTPTELKKKGTYRLRFANFDQRLTVWVDNSLPFGSGVNYHPPKDRGPEENDLLAARVGVRGAAVIVDHLKVWRDSYYTVARDGGPAAADADGPQWTFGSEEWRKPEEWDALRRLPFKTMYVQPGHYLCMGDNSPESSDGRTWGLVPRRLMLGRALLVYWPYNRAGPIR